VRSRKGIVRRSSNLEKSCRSLVQAFYDWYVPKALKDRERPLREDSQAQAKGRWLFVNFHYGKRQHAADENLVNTLKSLQANRQKYAK